MSLLSAAKKCFVATLKISNSFLILTYERLTQIYQCVALSRRCCWTKSDTSAFSTLLSGCGLAISQPLCPSLKSWHVFHKFQNDLMLCFVSLSDQTFRDMALSRQKRLSIERSTESSSIPQSLRNSLRQSKAKGIYEGINPLSSYIQPYLLLPHSVNTKHRAFDPQPCYLTIPLLSVGSNTPHHRLRCVTG